MDSTALSVFQEHFLWALIVGAILAFLLGFAMGANDFGTSVGSKVLSLRTAYILATIFETLGTVLVGFNVTDEMRKNVVDISEYENEPNELLLGQLAILGGGTIWLFIATFLNTPISTTHSIVGATLGFTLLLRGTEGIYWPKIIEIALSWIVSPILSGICSCVMYIIVDLTVLRKKDALTAGLRALPFIYFCCIAFNIFAVSYQGSKILHLSDVPLWVSFLLSFGIGILSGFVFHFFVSPRLLKWIEKKEEEKNTTNSIEEEHVDELSKNKVYAATAPDPKLVEIELENVPVNTKKQVFSLSPRKFIFWFMPDRKRLEDRKTVRLFSAIQVFTACFAGFAHGANDVSNSIAPVTTIWSIYQKGESDQTGQTPIYILLYGVLASCIGLWVLGHRVIKTVGQKMSKINPASGFCIEFGTAATVLLASKAGLPISTSHCLVGSVVAVGCVRTGKGVDWKVFRTVALSWLITLPVSALLSLIIMFILKKTLL